MTCCSRFAARAASSRARCAWTAAALVAALPFAACQKGGSSGAGSSGPAAPLAPLPAYDPAAPPHRQVSGEKLLAWAQSITAFGPRPSGSDALEKTRQFLEAELKALGWETRRQSFEDTTPRGRITFVNLRARFTGGQSDPWDRPTPVLVASHYDTKVFTDFTFVGANDGASGNAVQLELARLLAASPESARRIELVFFDGEEASIQYTPLDGLHGSRHYARAWRDWPRDRRPARGLLLDMVGEKDLRIEIPANQSSAALRTLALRAAEEAGHPASFGLSSQEILDDHVPLGMAGIDMVNFIDLNYGVWHTAGDTVDKLSADSLAITTRVALVFIERYLLRSP